ncbi:arginine deiminase [Clostridium niameyense]|uniref:Arginine deiminase n=1 Tax=Clostridium niameyense TaxID=1622073 RepID=A0A6M0RAW3_9CLOT|nr:arginine deiminase [Clostridium niameyense]NEZ47356.1 arginine deiminase [Clostridium niameyense]
MSNKKRNIHVYSEIGNLKTVLLHRPGEEIENLTPDYLEKLLFDDIPFLKVAREEHDIFAKTLRDNGVEVLYLEDLAAQSIEDIKVKEKFITEVIKESGIKDKVAADKLKEYLYSMSNKEIIYQVMAGLRKNKLNINEHEDYPFLMYPMPNLYFTRDPFACIGKGVSLNSMRTETRKRETIFGKYIFKYNPEFKDSDIPLWYDRGESDCIEGGDELVLSPEVIAVGHSQRTDSEAVLKLAKKIFETEKTFKVVLLFEIPKTRAFMHLDTVFTMLDYDKFTVHGGIEGTLKVNAISYDEKNKELIVKEEVDSLEKILSKYLKRDIKVIRCGGGDVVISAREQWNDGSNTLAIAPGKVITYERNYVTNEILDKSNVEVLTIPSSELSRGRGGPRCMSMPLYREDLNNL